jgi:His/Glu/Gln/Arg/opine family amino acid ABC transporter permease subunit
MARNAAPRPKNERISVVMHENVMGSLASARRRATRVGRFARLTAGALALAAAGCQRSESTITTLDEAATARIGVMGGSVGEQIVLERFPKAEIKTFDDIMDAVSALRARQLDAVVTAYPGALQVTKKNRDLKLLPEPLSAENTAVAARPADTALLAAVNRTIDSLRADGTLAEMRARWFKPDLSPYHEPEIAASPTGEPLTIGVSATREPFSFVDGSGRISGHDGELARRLGALLNRPVVFSDMKLMALIPALQSGKIDLVVTGMADTPERRKRVAFSTSYYENAQRMMVFVPDRTLDVGAGFAKSHGPLRAQFDAHLAVLKTNGTYADMKHRWIETGATDMPTIEAPRPNGVLTVGVNDGNLPFAGTKDGRMTGFDIELVERFAASLGKTVSLTIMHFDSLTAAAESGKVDLIISSIYITPDRQQRIDFSAPYFRMNTRAFGVESESVAAAAPSWLEGIGASIQSNLIQEQRYLLLLAGLQTTVLIALLSSLFGTLLGALVCYMRMSANRLLSLTAQGYIAVLRGTPVVVLLMLVFYVVFASVNISPVLVAVLAFGMNFAAYVAEIFRSGIEGIDRGQTEAGLSMGFTKVATFTHIVLPQTVQRVLPVYKGEFISLVKMTSIVGYIAVQDLTKASDIIRSRTFDAFFPLVLVAILYFFIAWILTRALDALERRTDPRQRRQARSTA